MFFDRSSLHGILKANGQLYVFKEETWRYVNDRFRLELDDVSHVDEIQINGMNFCYKHTLSLHRLEGHLFNVERCMSLSEFVVLAKMDFQQERHLRKRMFG